MRCCGREGERWKAKVKAKVKVERLEVGDDIVSSRE